MPPSKQCRDGHRPSACRSMAPFFICISHPVRRRHHAPKGPLVQRGLCPKGGGGLYRWAGGYNPSVTLRVPPPFTQGRLPSDAGTLMRTVGDAGPYGGPTGAKASLCKGRWFRRNRMSCLFIFSLLERYRVLRTDRINNSSVTSGDSFPKCPVGIHREAFSPV